LNTDPVVEEFPEGVVEPDGSSRGMDDVPQLMKRIQNREQKAMAELYVLCHQKVLKLVLFLVKNEHDARDITQDVFLRVWRYASAYDAEKSNGPMSWINQVARNQVLTEMARRKRRKEVDGADIDQIPDEDENGQMARLTAQSPAFESALSGLNPSVKKVILLRFFCEKSVPEISLEMDVPLGTVKTWLHRGLAKMKTQLDGTNLEVFNATRK
jgi:RNA polymerase sigma-70 factor (ECF subfamily)